MSKATYEGIKKYTGKRPFVITRACYAGTQKYRKYIKLRYRLLPYLYDLMWECENTGIAPMRPLVLHYSEDSKVHEINDQFMFGKEMLVAPVIEQGKRYRALYLPNGTWYDY